MSIEKISWNFDNTYSCLPEIMFSRLAPGLVHSPKIIVLNNRLVDNLGLKFFDSSEKEMAALFSGNILPVGAAPIAQAYAGHQYGHLTMLGDGRAIVLGEHIRPDHQRVDIQLKGSGRTPYSRQGDGRAALSPMLREYVISEAMYALGIPTTRSLAVVATGEDVFRNTSQPGAILTRVASSHIRVGTFEYIATLGNAEILKKMVNYTIDRHYPYLKEVKNPALELLKAVIEKQIILITHWMRVGFIHGVMNTDNMTISGETIDYGPCAFMDAYDPKTVFSSIDRYGRYAFGNQPEIAQWNLTRFAEALLPLLHESQETAIQIAEDVLGDFSGTYQKHWLAMMRNKLGLFKQENEDDMLINDLLFWMQENKADYTNTFRALTSKNFPNQDEKFKLWHQRWQVRLSRNACALESSVELMRANNPAVIPRNHKVEEALKAASEQGDLTLLNRLLEVLSTPYEDFRSDDMSYQTPLEAGCVYKTFCGT
ncbi:MAG: YdiU family protein [Gammaproteobacteria bacterium]|nr:YdiU family protein [Gammaproteobacteria bacterium]